MKKIENNTKSNFLKKIFIKLCRLMGYEIIDQNKFFVPTLNKSINSTLSTQGKNSINLPLGEVKITRSIKSFDIIIRSCASVKMLTQNKNRIFEKEKIEYTLRSIKSILSSVLDSKKNHPNILFKIIIVDHNSSIENLNKIENLIKQSNLEYELFNLKVDEFKNRINPINQKNEKSTLNQISNMCNIYKSLELSKSLQDLVYFVEDDYIHENQCISEINGIEDMFVFPPMGDEGLCVGYILDYLLKRDGNEVWLGNRRELENVYWGDEYSISKEDLPKGIRIYNESSVLETSVKKDACFQYHKRPKKEVMELETIGLNSLGGGA